MNKTVTIVLMALIGVLCCVLWQMESYASPDVIPEGSNAYYGPSDLVDSIAEAAKTDDIVFASGAMGFDPNEILIDIESNQWEYADLSMNLHGIEIIFKHTNDKFDVIYDPNKCTESAEAFFVCLKEYFKGHLAKGEMQ